jgi:hypothetical protein
LFSQKHHTSALHCRYGIFATLAKNHPLDSLSVQNKSTFKYLHRNGTENSDFILGDFVYPWALWPANLDATLEYLDEPRWSESWKLSIFCKDAFRSDDSVIMAVL